MRHVSIIIRVFWVVLAIGLVQATATRGQDPLPSWNSTHTKQVLLDYIQAVTTPGSPDFIPIPDRIAVFDNDCTLCTEKPLSFETYFMISRLKARLSGDPGLAKQPTYHTLVSGSDSAIERIPWNEYDKAMADAYQGSSLEEFQDIANQWEAAWRHPKFGKSVRELYYLPMRELMDCLRANGFSVFVVTGSTSDFVRTFSEEAYGIPASQVIGTALSLKYRIVDGRSYVIRQSRVETVASGPNKPVLIERQIGRRPVFAAGNGSTDPEMLTYTADGSFKSLCILIHHDDSEREYAYTNERLYELARQKGWPVVRMKEDWKVVFPLE